ncbi:MAG: glucan biosynthesis protein D [Halothiobacillaceae bacterium]|nr:glucan biosynthesis protein D [Halothiobacillaceae bacterium]
MSVDSSRRRFLAALAGLPFVGALTPEMLAAAEGVGLSFGDAQPFDFDMLRKMAKEMADKAYKEPPRPNPEAVMKINYDEQGRIKFKYEYALWGNGPSVFPVTFRPVGSYFQKSVRMFAVDNGQAREVMYQPSYFSFGPASPMNQLAPGDSAIAGFWAMESRKNGDWTKKEPWATFQGGSYFRAVGELGQVGMSARGIALNVGGSEPEEFPDFRSFWIEPALKEGDPLVVYALLDGPSVTGAYRISMSRSKGVVMDIESYIFMRKSVERLGIAPLTSMFWYAEYPAAHSHDWRPEVHDSDTLVMWTGTGERIARPLNNPNRIIASSFTDNNPKGFGLSQRDRDYDHYLDGVSYDRRPSVWVETQGDWGKGRVQLIEIPTDDEVYDNIGVFWVPDKQASSGASFSFKYRLHWLANTPNFPASLARAVALRIGRGGEPGKDRPANAKKLVIEWDGEVLKNIPWGVRPKVVVTASRGKLSLMRTEPIWYTPRWRSEFDLAADGGEPIELRAFLEIDGKPLTETWLYQYQP